jgi:hypothetical protein
MIMNSNGRICTDAGMIRQSTARACIAEGLFIDEALPIRTAESLFMKDAALIMTDASRIMTDASPILTAPSLDRNGAAMTGRSAVHGMTAAMPMRQAAALIMKAYFLKITDTALDMNDAFRSRSDASRVLTAEAICGSETCRLGDGTFLFMYDAVQMGAATCPMCDSTSHRMTDASLVGSDASRVMTDASPVMTDEFTLLTDDFQVLTDDRTSEH